MASPGLGGRCPQLAAVTWADHAKNHSGAASQLYLGKFCNQSCSLVTALLPELVYLSSLTAVEMHP